jgi:allophanate hydrolase subunit 2
VAVNSINESTPVLGSVAPDLSLSVGDLLTDESKLRLRSKFAIRDHPFSVVPLFRPMIDVPRFGSPWVIDIVDGPECEAFSRTGDLLASEMFTVEPQSDAVGLRLSGETPVWEGKDAMLSRGVAIGAIEIPAPGSLLVLLRSRLLTAGYPVIAVATTAAQSELGQVRPGDSISFRRRSLQDAIADVKRQRATLEELQHSVITMLEASGIGEIVRP